MAEPLPATPALDAIDKRAAEGQKTPHRVTLDSIKAKIDKVEIINPNSMPHATIVLIVMKNGFVFDGFSCPADPANFDPEKGREFAFDQALKKAWPMEGYLLREKLSGSVTLGDERLDAGIPVAD